MDSSVLPTRGAVLIRLFMYTGNTFMVSGRISLEEGGWMERSPLDQPEKSLHLGPIPFPFPLPLQNKGEG